MGIHREAGLSRRDLAPADEVAEELLELLLGKLDPKDDVWVLVNTFGATPLMEGLVVLRRVALDDELRHLLDAPGRALSAPPLDEPW